MLRISPDHTQFAGVYLSWIIGAVRPDDYAFQFKAPFFKA